jgi:DNA polymerase III delta prime subunit
MFLIDKYIPKSYNELYFHKNIYNFLQKMSEDESIPHLIFSGIFGKKTMVKLFLEMLYGEEVKKTKQIKYIISGSGNNANEEYFTESPYHIEINPKGTNNDRYLIQDVINCYAQRSNYNIFHSKHNFKIIVIYNTQKMLSSVQFSLRRTIEKYSDTCKFIIITNSITKIIKPLLSRCKNIRLRYPEQDEIIKYIIAIARKESISLSLNKITYIVKHGHNIKDILWILQLYLTFNLYVHEMKKIMKFYDELLKSISITNKSITSDIDTFINTFEKIILNLDFQFININNFINVWGTKFYDHLKNKLKELISLNDYKRYFVSALIFNNKFNKNIIKKIKFNVDDKKNKNQLFLTDLNMFFDKFIKLIKLCEIKLDKNIIIDRLINHIINCNYNEFDEIRDIYFNMSITNFSSTDIIKCIINKILLIDSISDHKKMEIVQLCSDVEYQMIIGRREIIQYDLLIIMIMNIINKKK